MHTAVTTVNTAKTSALKGYRSVGDVTFDLDSTLSTNIGWVILEVDDSKSAGTRGLIGTFSNYVMLMLIRFKRRQKPCRIHGWFDDGTTGTTMWRLDDVAFTGFLVRDVNGFIGFRASEANQII